MLGRLKDDSNATVAGLTETVRDIKPSADIVSSSARVIGDSVEKTNAGTRLVGNAGETMAEIVTAVKGVTDIMAVIAAASLQQGSGIGQVNEAVSQMDKSTQQNAALVEQIAASAKASARGACARARHGGRCVYDGRLVKRGETPRPTHGATAVPKTGNGGPPARARERRRCAQVAQIRR